MIRKRLSIQTEALARASARHPWRTLAAWLVAVGAALAAAAAFMSTSLVGRVR